MRNEITVGLAMIGTILSTLLPGYGADGGAPEGAIAALWTAGGGSPTPVVEEDLPWYLDRINAASAWRVAGAGKNIIVAVLDTGIDTAHEDLTGRVAASVNFGPSTTTDDRHGHGTMVAGVITATFDNMKGATGIAYESSLLNVKVAGDDGFVTAKAVARGIIWALDNGAQVINLSLTLSKPSPEVEEAVRYAWENGAVIVAAAGNNPAGTPVYPAASPNVISVGATDRNDARARWSPGAEWVSVNAPGASIYSTLPANSYALKSGTSYSSALVAGEAALLLSIAADSNGNGRLNDEVRDAILSGTRAGTTGVARIDALAAINRLAGQ